MYDAGDGQRIAAQVKPRLPRISDIQQIVCATYGLTMEEMKSPCRKRRVAVPRQIAVWLCRKMTDASYPKLGRSFRSPDNPMDHTVTLYAFRKIEEWQGRDAGLAETLRGMRRQVEEITALRAIFSPPPPPPTPPLTEPTKRRKPRLLTTSLPREVSKRVEVLDLDAWLSLNGEVERFECMSNLVNT